MAEYSYQSPAMGYSGVVIETTKGLYIPCDLANRDYQEFLAWIAEGNTAPTGWTGPTNPTGSPSLEQSPPTEGTA